MSTFQMSMQQSDPRMHYVKELAAAGMRGAALTHQLLAENGEALGARSRVPEEEQ